MKIANDLLQNHSIFLSRYDSAIFNYFNQNNEEVVLKLSEQNGKTLHARGENPHQQGFFGNFDEMFNKLHGKELSYNNLLDVDAVNLMNEFLNEAQLLPFEHNNACGLAQRDTTPSLCRCIGRRSCICFWWSSNMQY